MRQGILMRVLWEHLVLEVAKTLNHKMTNYRAHHRHYRELVYAEFPPLPPTHQTSPESTPVQTISQLIT